VKNNNVSLSSIFVDQAITGFENLIMNELDFHAAVAKYSAYGDAGNTKGQRVRINISQSLHYMFLKKPESYTNHYLKYIEMTNQLEHSLEKFIELRSDFSLELLRANPIQLIYLGDGEYQVVDGFHRLALYSWFTGKKSIPHEYLTGLVSNEIKLNSGKVEVRLRKALARIHNQGFYNSWAIGRDFEAGYHGFQLFGFKVKGQRDNSKRLIHLCSNIDLNERRILDLGCNSGGFLFHIPIVDFAIGLDFDKNAIAFANLLKKSIEIFDPELASRYEFKQIDLNKMTPAELTKTIIKKKIDLVLLLSMGSWLNNWKEIYGTVAMSEIEILLETNNDSDGFREIEFLESFEYVCRLISTASVDDNSGNIGRKTYLCSKR
jgi:hypothetical protein